VDVYVQPCRTYPQGTLAAHVLGFTGVAELSADGDEPFHYYLPEIGGKAGVECRMNDALSGRAGGSLICVDAAGFKHAEISRREAVPGRDVILSIDARIQQLTEQVLADKPGAVVVMNPMNGDVLAMASWPAFNPNDFTPFIPTALWNRLSEDPLRPMLNRAAAGLYPPGSLFKPLVAIAALENGRATPETWFDCPGYFSIGGTQLKCWNLNGHGSLALRKAIEQSCNTYFAALGLQCGYDIIRHTAEAAGLGSRTGIALDYEARGLLPSREWKRQRLGDAWRDGDTCNVSVGQGPVIVTPLQMAVVLSAVANGGHVYRPRLVLETRRREGSDFQPVPSEEVNNLHWSEATLTAVRNGMHDAVEAPSGTGAAAHVPGVRMAGKTGTAEYGPKEEDKRRGWMMVYAPFDNPRYAVVAVLDDAVSGGGTVGPLIREIMRGIFGMTEGEG
jgi:penicillin-binding protein 2